MAKNKKYKSYSDFKEKQEDDLDDGPMYVSWNGQDDTERQKAFASLNDSIDEFTSVSRASNRNFDSLQTNVSGRPGMTREDYDSFRPNEAKPKFIHGIIQKADAIYQRVGLIRNYIDLMGDFGTQGMRITHPNKKIEKWHQNWWAKVCGNERSERFLNNLYRTGTVVMRRQMAKITGKQKESLYKTSASSDVSFEVQNTKKNEIPLKYVLLNPIYVEPIGGSLGNFSGLNFYGVKIPSQLSNIINSPRNEAERAIVDALPLEIKQAAKSNQAVMLDPEKTEVYSYKKDDWQQMAFPMIYSIMDDISLLMKLKLADAAALDGAISNLRIIKLGSLEHGIMPKRSVFSKLSNILEANTGGGTMDLIWGPDIELIESKTQVHQFLGEEKYRPTMMSIYAGLGIPPTLTGMSGASGTTNNFVSLQTLIQRLEYGRTLLVEFWTKEFQIIQKAMGWRFPAKVEFEIANLGDQQAEKRLLLQLADRSLISDELLQKKLGHDPDMEKIRLNREKRDRDGDRMVEKAGPYHRPDFNNELMKLFVQQGTVSPSEAGLELEERKEGEKSPAEVQGERAEHAAKMKDDKQPQPTGKPPGSVDEDKSSPEFRPKSKAILEIWADYAQKAIAEQLNPALLQNFGKKNMRSLSSEEHHQAEMVKFATLYNLKPLCAVEDSVIKGAVSGSPLGKETLETYNEYISQVSKSLSRNLSSDECRKIQCLLYISEKGV